MSAQSTCSGCTLGRQNGFRLPCLIFANLSETSTQNARTPTVLGALDKSVTLDHIQQETRDRLALSYQAYEAHLSDGREYLLKSGFSAVDIMNGWGVLLMPQFLRFDFQIT